MKHSSTRKIAALVSLLVGGGLVASAAQATEPFRLTTEIYKSNKKGNKFRPFKTNKDFDLTVRLYDSLGVPLEDAGGTPWEERITVSPSNLQPNDLVNGRQTLPSKVSGIVSLIVGAKELLPEGFDMDVFYTTQVTQGNKQFVESPLAPLGNSTAAIDTSDIADDAIGAQQIAAGAVGSEEILDEAIAAVDIGAGAVGSSEIADGSVTGADIASETITSADIGANAVGTSEITDGSITGTDIASETITSADIATNAVGGSEIANGSITNADIAANTIGQGQIATSGVGSAEIANGSITSADIAANTIGQGQIATSGVGSSEIANGSVTGADIAANTIGQSDIATSGVGSAEIASSAVRGAEISTISVVSVECNGGCADVNLGQVCGSGSEAIAVDCQSVDADNQAGTFACGTNNVCFRNTVFSSAPLGNFCDDTSGWDAQVYCISTN